MNAQGLSQFLKNNSAGVGAGIGAASGIVDSTAKDGMGKSIISNAMKGAAAGSVAGPWGIAAGAAAGIVAGIVKQKGLEKELERVKAENEKKKLDESTQQLAMEQSEELLKEEQMMATGGIVKGKAGIDKVKSKLPVGAFVVPKENANHPVVKNASAMLGYSTADKTKGSADVMLTRGEVVVTPKDVPVVDAMAKAKGMVNGINDLAPNAERSKYKKCGGKVRKHMDDGGLVGLQKTYPNYKIYQRPEDKATNWKAPYYAVNEDGWFRIDESGKIAENPIHPVRERGSVDALNTTFNNGNNAAIDLIREKELKFTPPTVESLPEEKIVEAPIPEPIKVGLGTIEPKTPASGSDPGLLQWKSDPVAFEQKYGSHVPTPGQLDIGTAMGAIQGGLGLAGILASGKNPAENDKPEYKIPEFIMRDVAKLAAKRDSGIDEAVKNSMLKDIETQRQNDLNAGKEYSGGSGVTAFNRAILANTNATAQKGKIALADQELRDKNLDLSIRSNLGLAAMHRTIYEDRFKNKLLDQENWQEKQRAWAGLLNAGITNVVGASQLKKEQKANEAFRKMLYGKS